MNIAAKRLALALTCFFPLSCVAHDVTIPAKAASTADSATVNRALLTNSLLPNIEGHRLTSVTVELKPGVTVPSHQHDAFVFVYVLQGQVISQLNKQASVEYKAGDHWLELPSDIHSATQNPSKTEMAKFLVIFIAKDDARLTTSGELTKGSK